jgi:RNA polymerase subunit RPABC4/transcription elongation factor Spt4
VVVLVVLSSGSFWALGASSGGAPAAPPSHGAALAPEVVPALTHGDLVVLSGETYTIQPTASSHIYYQGGNITVDAGGTLNVVNVSLVFVEFVGSSGTAMSRVSHVMHFTDAGTVNFHNSLLTTDVQILNAYAKLPVTVTGALNVWNSTFAFPGWLRATGAGATITFNGSKLEGNPAVKNLSEPSVIQGDTEYAPSLTASGGAVVSFFNSSYRQVYGDNFRGNGIPSTAPLNTSSTFTFPAGGGAGTYNATNLVTANDSANLTRDWAYPSGIATAQVQMIYTNINNVSGTAGVTVWMDGKGYNFGTINFGPAVSNAIATANASGAFVTALNTAGLLQYLNWTGSFGAGPLKIAIEFTGISSPALPFSIAELVLFPTLSFDVQASGAGTIVNAVDSAFGLTWTALPNSQFFSTQPPFAWDSNKLELTGGAKAYLANMTVTGTVPGVFSTSAVLADATSQAYFYRWAELNLTGRGGYLPIADAHVSAFYAYNQNQSNNATANGLNQLSTANPAIWGYVQYWDGQHGLPAYGETGRAGQAFLLLAVGNLTAATLPDGIFLGGYHIGVVIPIATSNTKWFNWSLSPYPGGVANGTANYGSPDYGPAVNFPAYFSSLTVGTVVLTQNGSALVANSIAPDRVLGVDVPLLNTGEAQIYNLSGALYYGALPSGQQIASVPLENLSVTPGQTAWENFTWTVTSAITGIAGSPGQLFTFNATFNGGNLSLGGGNLTNALHITVLPYAAHLTVAPYTLLGNGTPLLGNTVRIGQGFDVHVTLNYTGTVPLTDFSVSLIYNATTNLSTKPLAAWNSTGRDIVLNNSGQQYSLWLNWTVVDTITGLQGKTFLHNFTIGVLWIYAVQNFQEPLIVLNNTTAKVPVEIAPSQVRILSMVTPPSTIDLGNQYYASGVFQYNGSQLATLELFAIPIGGAANPVLIGSGPGASGKFSFDWSQLSGLLSPGTSYTLSLTATYNGVTAYYNLTGPFSVPPSTSAQGFLFQTFLGLPLWLWLAIVAAIVVAILAVLLISRRQAAGKLVECGECGNLIPEDATVCPKCGAEFETDLIRCSRCASTIPADSQYCPECAAQLLGKPGEGAADPERQGYSDFTERYRAEGKKELGENYNEGSFWDWWKRQPTYTSFSQWKLQQGQSASRSGMSAPPVGTETEAPAPAGKPPAGGQPPKGGGAATSSAAAAPAAKTAPGAPPAAAPPPVAGALKPCPNCGKEIPPEYLVCPFCGSVTQ